MVETWVSTRLAEVEIPNRKESFKMKEIFTNILKGLKWALKKIQGFIMWVWKKKGWLTAILLLLVVFYGGFRVVKKTQEVVSGWFKSEPASVQSQKTPPSPTTTSSIRGVVSGPPQPATVSGGRGGNVARGIRPMPTYPQGQFQAPVREPSPHAVWIASARMFKDEQGYFITPPNVKVWGKDERRWSAPFEKFAQAHPDQAGAIAQQYAGQNYRYLNAENIVRKYGPQAQPR